MPKTFQAHWRDADLSRWRWPNFIPAEIACRGTAKLLIDEEALDRLQALRDALRKPLIVRSVYRSPEPSTAPSPPGISTAAPKPPASSCAEMQAEIRPGGRQCSTANKLVARRRFGRSSASARMNPPSQSTLQHVTVCRH